MRGTESGTLADESTDRGIPNDAGLIALVGVWCRLPQSVKEAIVAMVKAAEG